MQRKEKRRKTVNHHVEYLNDLFTEKDKNRLLQDFVYLRTMKQLQGRMRTFSDELQMKIIKMKLKQARTTQQYVDISLYLFKNVCDKKSLNEMAIFWQECKDLDAHKELIYMASMKNLKSFLRFLEISPLKTYTISAGNIPIMWGMSIGIRHPKVNITSGAYIKYFNEYLQYVRSPHERTHEIVEIFKMYDLSLVPTLTEYFREAYFHRSITSSGIFCIICMQFPDNRYNTERRTWTGMDNALVRSWFKFMTLKLQKHINTFMLMGNRIRETKGCFAFPKNIERMIVLQMVTLQLNHHKKTKKQIKA